MESGKTEMSSRAGEDGQITPSYGDFERAMRTIPDDTKSQANIELDCGHDNKSLQSLIKC